MRELEEHLGKLGGPDYTGKASDGAGGALSRSWESLAECWESLAGSLEGPSVMKYVFLVATEYVDS